MDANTLLPLVLGAGGVAFLGTVFQFIQSIRNSAESRESKALSNIERWANECQENLRYESDVSAYWRRRAATLEHLCLSHGVETPGMEPPPVRPPTPR